MAGTIISAPRDARGSLSPELFKRELPPDFTLAAMNFIVQPDGANGSMVSTETRVFANSDGA